MPFVARAKLEPNSLSGMNLNLNDSLLRAWLTLIFSFLQRFFFLSGKFLLRACVRRLLLLRSRWTDNRRADNGHETAVLQRVLATISSSSSVYRWQQDSLMPTWSVRQIAVSERVARSDGCMVERTDGPTGHACTRWWNSSAAETVGRPSASLVVDRRSVRRSLGASRERERREGIGEL